MALSDHIRKDSPTNNFATLNPLIGGATTLSEGNLYSTISGVNHGAIPNFTLPSSGIWYTEFKFHSIPAGYPAVGLSVYNKIGWNTAGSETDPQSLTFNNSGGTANWEEYGSAFSFSNEVNNINAVINTTNVYALYWDADTNKLTLYDGTNTSSVDVTVNTSQPISFIYAQSSGSTYTVSVNFGQDPTFGGNKTDSAALNPQTNDANGDPTNGAFYYTPPAGAKALCTANLEDITPDVDDDVPKDYFKAKVYSGTGSNQNIDIGFNPDFVWTKQRNGTEANWFASTVLGTNYVVSINPQAGTASGSGIGVNDFSPTSTSYQVSSQNGINISGTDNLVSWSWKAGGFSSDFNIDGNTYTSYDNIQSANSSNFPASNVGGTPAILTPNNISVNTKSGFSCLTFTGTGSAAKIPHGLGSAPKFFISKRIDNYSASHWDTWHVGLGATKSILFNGDYAEYVTDRFYDTAPDNLYYYVKTDGGVNSSGSTHVTFLWSEIAGYSAFGSYTGNGSTTGDGPFVYTGFRPAWIMIKNTSISENWTIRDAARTPYNPNQLALYSNLSNSDDIACPEIDFLSNGFKLRANQANLNQSNGTGYNYIYAAFAEQPTKYATAR